jgi:hypothetical protein
MAIFDRRRHSWLFYLWVIVGLVVAWEKAYINVHFLEALLSALLSIFLWPLILLGVNMHIH